MAAALVGAAPSVTRCGTRSSLLAGSETQYGPQGPPAPAGSAAQGARAATFRAAWAADPIAPRQRATRH